MPAVDWPASTSNLRKSSLQPALRVLRSGRSIFLKRLVLLVVLPRDDDEDGVVSGDAEPRPLLVSAAEQLDSLPVAVRLRPPTAIATSSVELLLQNDKN